MTLVDSHGREIGSIRISLTDRCNLRCQYCMPEDGINWLDKNEILSFEEIYRLVNVFYTHGIRKYRLTGGEPLVRKDIVSFVDVFTNKFPIADLAMTTNGIGLVDLASDLRSAGLQRLNISLDTLDHKKYADITRRDVFDQVISGIEMAISLGFDVKINAVSIKKFNDDIDSLRAFVDFSKKYNIEVRFIEVMPFTGNNWRDREFVSSNQLRQKLSNYETLKQLPMVNKSSTSKTWLLRDGDARIGFISSVSESFCETCNRLRLTADGKLRPCLHNAREYDLKNPLRQGASDDKILEIIQVGLNEKWREHPDFLALKYKNPVEDREMIRIGG